MSEWMCSSIAGRYGGIRAIEAAACALESDRAGTATGFDVGRFGAVAERDRYRCPFVGQRVGERARVARASTARDPTARMACCLRLSPINGTVGYQNCLNASAGVGVEACPPADDVVGPVMEFDRVSPSRRAAANVRGVGHPVAGGSALPGDSDADVDAEHAGEDGGGEFGGELEKCGGAH